MFYFVFLTTENISSHAVIYQTIFKQNLLYDPARRNQEGFA
jgi:hypothetical protein